MPRFPPPLQRSALLRHASSFKEITVMSVTFFTFGNKFHESFHTTINMVLPICLKQLLSHVLHCTSSLPSLQPTGNVPSFCMNGRLHMMLTHFDKNYIRIL